MAAIMTAQFPSWSRNTGLLVISCDLERGSSHPDEQAL
jgi:hypothetical protein